jgi:hypothetical protein
MFPDYILVKYSCMMVTLLNGKNQVADGAGIRKKIGSQILSFRIIIFKFRCIHAERSNCAARFFHFRSIELL